MEAKPHGNGLVFKDPHGDHAVKERALLEREDLSAGDRAGT